MQIFSAIREVAENIRNMSNTVNVSGGGATLWQGTVNIGQTVVIASGLNYVAGRFIVKRVDNGVYTYTDFNIKTSQSYVVATGVTVELLSNGTLHVVSSTYNYEATLSFMSDPLMGGGLVGPVGATGATGQPGADGQDALTWGNWSNITLNSGVDNEYPAEPARYRVSVDGSLAQIQLSVISTTTWSSSQTIFTLPADARPIKAVRSHGMHTDGVTFVTIAINGSFIVSTGIANNKKLRFIEIYPLN